MAAKRNNGKNGPSNDENVNITAAEGSQGPALSGRLICDICHREFPTKRGLGVHRRAKHPQEYHERALEEFRGKTEVKKRWSQEEVNAMALAEAKLFLELGPTDRINQLLQEHLPERTVEAIKGKRRPAAYKKKVQDLIASLAPEVGDSPSISASNEDPQTPPTPCRSPNSPSLPRSPEYHDIDYMLEDTEIYFSPEIYINNLNSDDRIRGPITEDERSLLDAAF